jgi:hypothetical protein
MTRGRAELTAIVKHRTHQRGQLGYLYITSINLPDSITIAIHPPPSNDEQSIDLKFDPPVEDGFEVRTRLFEWRDKAFEHFDVVRPYLYLCEYTDKIARDAGYHILFETCHGPIHFAYNARSQCSDVCFIWNWVLCRGIQAEDRIMGWKGFTTWFSGFGWFHRTSQYHRCDQC